MSEAPTITFQRALREALLGAEAVAEIVNGAILDGNPAEGLPPVPSIVMRDAELGTDHVDCVKVYTLAITLDAWRGDNGRLHPVRELNFRIVEALDGRVLHMGEYGDAMLELDGTARDMLDADGLTGHGVLTFVCEIEDAG